MDNRKFKIVPSAYLVPKLLDFSKAKNVHFTFNESINTLDEDELVKAKQKAMNSLDKTVVYDVSIFVDNLQSLCVTDKND